MCLPVHVLVRVTFLCTGWLVVMVRKALFSWVGRTVSIVVWSGWNKWWQRNGIGGVERVARGWRRRGA